MSGIAGLAGVSSMSIPGEVFNADGCNKKQKVMVYLTLIPLNSLIYTILKP